MGNNSDKLSGKAKQLVGNATNNKKLQAQGKAQEISGRLKDKTKDASEKLTDKLDETAKKLTK